MMRLPGTWTLLVLLALLPACGGGGGGGTGSGGGTLPDTTPPVVTLVAPSSATFLLPGDPLEITFSADDQQEANVQVVLDPDHDPVTEDGRIVLYADTDRNGQEVTTTASSQGVLPGAYSLFVIADDGIHDPTASAPAYVVVGRGVAGVAPNRRNRYAVVERYVVFTRGEAEDGFVILNGDGAADDGVAALLDVVSGALLTSPATVDVTGPLPLPAAQPFAVYGTDVAWHRREADEGRDFNGDGDALDGYVAWMRLPGDTSVHMLATPGVALVPTAVEFPPIISLFEGAGNLDFSGDGDTFDTLLGWLDPAPATAMPYGFPPRPGVPFRTSRGGSWGAYLVDEAAQGFLSLGLDLNGDGDTADTMLRYVSLSSNVRGLGGTVPAFLQPPRTLDPTAAYAASDSSWLAYVVDEGLSSGAPINGDLDTTDFCVALYDAATQTEAIPGLGLQAGAGARFLLFGGSRALYPGMDEPGLDRNGDGDAIDRETVFWTDVSNPGAATPVVPGVGGLRGIALDGGLVAGIEDSPGWFALVVVEQANATDLNGDGDTSDRIFALLDATLPVPVVHWTGLTPLPLGTPTGATIPETGVGGTQGVVVQAQESVNGDLNGDGDASDAVLVFFPFADPSSPVVFGDTGALHVTLQGDLVATCAREALTGVDLDGDGDATDTVFRLLRTDGSVVVRGLPCDAASVPVTETGHVWAYLRSEAAEFRDLNGDGDATDLVLGIWLDALPAPPGP